MRIRTLLVTLAAVALLAAPAGAASYEVDPAHTTVAFKIRHLVTTVTGRFDRFAGKITLDDAAPEKTRVEGTIEAASINTGIEKRDNHLRSPDFFDVEKYPSITFRTDKVSDVDREKKTAKLHGTLALHGVEKPIVFDATFLGLAKDPQGNQRAGFSGRTTIQRKDFGIGWNKVLDAGGLLLGEEVTIEIDVEAIAGK